MASFRIHTFGCKVNQCDSQIIRETLTSWGLSEAESSRPSLSETTAPISKSEKESGPDHLSAMSKPDLIVINTCTVTSTADAKFRKALRRSRRENPHAVIVVTGCYANRAGGNGRAPHAADMVFRQHDFAALADFLGERGVVCTDAGEDAHAQSYFAEHTRAFLKIQDGCDSFCAYCIVPMVRTQLWSEEPEKVIAAINQFSSKGYREVVLTGIHLGYFGRDSGRDDLTGLLKKIEKECEIERIRLSSIEISEVTDTLLELIAHSDRICEHLHLPLQSGDDVILRKMGRKYSAASFLGRVENIRKRIPYIGLTTDVMAGFPGETEQHFTHTFDMVETMQFARTHVFRFSPRPGTKAAEMDSPVPPGMISSRAKRLIKAGKNAAHAFIEQLIGKTAEVLIENVTNDGRSGTGFTSNYIKVKVLGTSPESINKILPVRIVSVDADSGLATGQIVS